jgi:hypothetical protein
MIEVVLSDSEMTMAALVGVRRHLDALHADLPDAFGARREGGFDLHIAGALGEACAAKALNRYWDASVGTFRTRADVGTFEVRTRSSHEYDMLLRPSDDGAKHYVLVTGAAPGPWRVWGYIKGADGKRPEFLREHGRRVAAFFVPKEELTPL